jgi:hypothetical protein
MIKEADVLAKKQNKELRVFYNALYPLKSAMKSVGWNNSSFNC